MRSGSDLRAAVVGLGRMGLLHACILDVLLSVMNKTKAEPSFQSAAMVDCLLDEVKRRAEARGHYYAKDSSRKLLLTHA